MAAYFVGLVDWQTEIGADVDYSGQLLDVVGVGEVSNSAGLEGYSCDALEAGRPDLGGGLVETVFGVDCDHDGLGLGDLAGGDVGQDARDNYFIFLNHPHGLLLAGVPQFDNKDDADDEEEEERHNSSAGMFEF